MQFTPPTYSDNHLVSRGLYGKSPLPKRYYLKNHLGNVLATVSDRKIGEDSNGDGQVEHYWSQVMSTQMYYPFGWQINSKSYNYQEMRFDFNDKETDRELVDWQNYGERMYMKRGVRFISVDPLNSKYPWLSAYQFAGLTPIQAIDRDGEEPSYKAKSGYWVAAGDGPMERKLTDKEVKIIFKQQVGDVGPKGDLYVKLSGNVSVGPQAAGKVKVGGAKGGASARLASFTLVGLDAEQQTSGSESDFTYIGEGGEVEVTQGASFNVIVGGGVEKTFQGKFSGGSDEEKVKTSLNLGYMTVSGTKNLETGEKEHSESFSLGFDVALGIGVKGKIEVGYTSDNIKEKDNKDKK